MKKPTVKLKKLSLPAERRLLVKAHCMRQAREILSRHLIEHMTAEEIAAELYFHAFVYYFLRRLERMHIRFDALMKSADPIDLCDYGDTPFRKFCFRVLWILPGGRSHNSDD